MFKEIIVQTPSNAMSRDTITIKLKRYKINTLIAIQGAFIETKKEEPEREIFTLSITKGILTIKLGKERGRRRTARRTFKIWGETK